MANQFLEMYPKEYDGMCVQYTYEDVYILFLK